MGDSYRGDLSPEASGQADAEACPETSGEDCGVPDWRFLPHRDFSIHAFPISRSCGIGISASLLQPLPQRRDQWLMDSPRISPMARIRGNARASLLSR